MVCKTMHSSSILLGTSTYWLVINYVVSMSGPRVSGGDSFFLYKAFSQEHFPVYLGFLVQREGVSPG